MEKLHIRYVAPILAVLFAGLIHAQNPPVLGTENGTPPSALYVTDAIAVSTANAVYFGTGRQADGGFSSAFRKYDPATNEWTTLPNVPGTGRSGSFAFHLNSKVYVGGGIGPGSSPNYSFYVFDPTNNTWTAMPSLPNYISGATCVIGTKAYIKAGTNQWQYDPVAETWSTVGPTPAWANYTNIVGVGSYGYAINASASSAFSRFEPSTNTWVALAPFPGVLRSNIVLYAIGNKVYAGLGDITGTNQSDLWEYDIATNVWLQRGNTPVPVPRRYVVTIGDYAYLMESRKVGLAVDVWQYHGLSDAWLQRKPLPGGTGRSQAVGMSINGYGYVGLGNGANGGVGIDWWQYDPNTTNWTAKASFPGSAATGIGLSDGSKGFVLCGAALWQYDPTANAWTMKANYPGTQAEVGFAIGGILYFSGAQLWAYNPSTDQWSARQACPNTAPNFAWTLGTAGFVGGYGSTNGDLWEYDPLTNVWTARAAYPGGARDMAASFAMGHRGYVGMGFNTATATFATDFWLYERNTNTWAFCGFDGSMSTARTFAASFDIGPYIHLGTGGGFNLQPYSNSFTTYDATIYDCQGVLEGPALPGAPCNDNNLNTANDTWNTTCVCTGTPIVVRVSIRALLEGPAIVGSNSMQDNLRASGYIPISEPYTALGYGFMSGGGEATTVPVLATTGNNAIVDWVIVELRAAGAPGLIVANRPALIQRDGDVVDLDGTSPVPLNAANGNYYVALRHRNHLGVMTGTPLALSYTPLSIDLTSAGTSTYGTDARKNSFGVMLLWAGDANFNGRISYTGASNDRDPILSAIGGSNPTSSLIGYRKEDVNMDAVVKYTGSTNDRDIVLQNIGGSTPTAVRYAQFP